MTRHYELTLIVDPQSGDEAVNQTVEKYESFLTDNGADPVVADRRGIRKLAYEIQKQTQADYTYFQFTVEGQMIQEMDRQLRLDQSAVRSEIPSLLNIALIAVHRRAATTSPSLVACRDKVQEI